MRNAGFLLLAWLALLTVRAEDSVSWEITPAVTGPGQPFRLQVRIESDVILGPADRVGKEIKPPRGMALRFSGQIFRSGTTEATLNFSGVSPETEGAHVIPSFNIRFPAKMIQVPKITLNVSNATGFRKDGQARAELELPDRTFYVGERIPGAILLRGSEQEFVSGSFGLECEAEGFSFQLLSDRAQPLDNGQGLLTAFELTPIRTGSSELSLNGIMLIQVGVTSAFSTPSRDRPFTFRRRINVEHVPEAGRPANWNGAIGKFLTDTIQLSNLSPEVGEPIRLRAILAGEGNLERIIPPEIIGGENWDIIPATERRRRAEDQRIFAYTLIPRLPGKLLTPEIRLATFDPETRSFNQVVFAPQEVIVTGTAPAKVDLVKIDPGAGANGATTKALAGLAPPQPNLRTALSSPVALIQPLAASKSFWATNVALFTLLSLSLGVVLVMGYLSTHPEILIRHHARRSCRRAARQAKQAAQAQDPAAFARAIVEGLRAGSSALLQAKAQALTQRDILRVLPDAPLDLLETLFQAASGDKFAPRPTSALLTEPACALDLLARLEAKL